tara:strand:- start:109 stop:525 length:417 start_codon:yes stop_codon:yes gene_type:complete
MEYTQNIMNKINNIYDKYVLYEIFKLIKKDTNEYTFNNNGIFVNLNILNENTLKSINDFINYTEYTNSLFKKEKVNVFDNIQFNENIESKKKEITKNKINFSKINSLKIEPQKLELNEPFNNIFKKCKEIDKVNTYEY